MLPDDDDFANVSLYYPSPDCLVELAFNATCVLALGSCFQDVIDTSFCQSVKRPASNQSSIHFSSTLSCSLADRNNTVLFTPRCWETAALTQVCHLQDKRGCVTPDTDLQRHSDWTKWRSIDILLTT